MKTTEKKEIDYSITDKQLQDIANGLHEMNDKNNSLIIIRTNEKANGKLNSVCAVMGTAELLVNGLINLMDEDPRVVEIFTRAVKMHTLYKMKGELGSMLKTLLEDENNE